MDFVGLASSAVPVSVPVSVPVPVPVPMPAAPAAVAPSASTALALIPAVPAAAAAATGPPAAAPTGPLPADAASAKVSYSFFSVVWNHPLLSLLLVGVLILLFAGVASLMSIRSRVDRMANAPSEAEVLRAEVQEAFQATRAQLVSNQRSFATYVEERLGPQRRGQPPQHSRRLQNRPAAHARDDEDADEDDEDEDTDGEDCDDAHGSSGAHGGGPNSGGADSRSGAAAAAPVTPPPQALPPLPRLSNAVVRPPWATTVAPPVSVPAPGPASASVQQAPVQAAAAPAVAAAPLAHDALAPIIGEDDMVIPAPLPLPAPVPAPAVPAAPAAVPSPMAAAQAQVAPARVPLALVPAAIARRTEAVAPAAPLPLPAAALDAASQEEPLSTPPEQLRQQPSSAQRPDGSDIPAFIAGAALASDDEDDDDGSVDVGALCAAHEDATRVHVPRVHDALCDRACRVDAALAALAAAVAAAHEQLDETRATLHATVDARIDALHQAVKNAAAINTAELERRRVAVDNAQRLQQWRADAAVGRRRSADADTTALDGHVGLPDVLARLHVTHAEQAAVQATLTGFGCVRAPHALSASNFTLRFVPDAVLAGHVPLMKLHLDCGPDGLAQKEALAPDEWARVLADAAASTRLWVTPCEPLRADTVKVTVSSHATSLVVSVRVPDGVGGCVRTCGGVSRICVYRITVAGVQVNVSPCVRLPSWVAVVDHASLEVSDAGTPCMTANATVVVPHLHRGALTLWPLNTSERLADPACSWSVDVDALQGHFVRWSACGPDAVYVGTRQGRLVALCPHTLAVRWTRDISCGHCFGVAVLPRHGVCLAVGSEDLEARDATSGVVLATARFDSGFGIDGELCSIFLAADDASGMVFLGPALPNIKGVQNTRGTVEMFLFDAASKTLTHQGCIPNTQLPFNNSATRPLAVVPPAPGKTCAHLVVGSYDSVTLHVLSLPDLRLVHTHDLGRVSLSDVAADPLGAHLLVGDRWRNVVHVLAWPLAGMPALT